MNIYYKNSKTKKECKDVNKAKKAYGPIAGEKLYATINFIECAEYLSDLTKIPMYHLHPLHGDMEGTHSIYVNKKNPACRLIIRPLDDNKNEWTIRDIITIYNYTKNILVEGVSNQHYE